MNLTTFLRTLLIAFGLASAGPSTSLFAEESTFGKDAPAWKIYLESDAPDSVQLAAKELSEYIQRVTGAAVPITSSLDGLSSHTIYLGNTKFARENKIEPDKLPSDGFRILTTANGIIITGKDFAGPPQTGTDNPYRLNETYNGKVKIGAFGDAGTLQGVYYFLREYFGVRWYMPGELGVVAPPLPRVNVPSIDLEKFPYFSYRYPYLCHFADAEQEALWYRRAGFGAPFPVEIQHTFDRFLKYKDSNPEFFALVDGQRDFTNLSSIEGSGNLNLSDPGLLKTVIRDINEYFDRDPSKMLYPLGPPDGMRRISEDPLSQSQIDLSMGESGKFSDYVWGFINKVAAGVGEKHPDKFIGCFAYEHYTKPPKKIAKLEPNVLVMICKQRRVFPNVEYEKIVRQSVDEWNVKASVIYSWEYYCDILFNGGWRGYPVFYPGNVQSDLQLLKGKVKGEMIEAESWTPDQAGNPAKTVMNYPGLQHPLLYVTSQLLWNPDADLKAMLDEYYKKFYGPGEVEMRAFWEATETAWMNKRGLNPGDVYSKDITEKLLAHLNAAITATEADSVYRKRVELIKNEFSPAAIKASRLAAIVKPEATISKAAKDEPVKAELANSIWEGEMPVLTFVDTAYTKANPPTHLRLAWTEKALKISMVCFEPKMDKTQGVPTEGRPAQDPAIWDNDSIEIFLKPNKAALDTYHFIVNSNGAFYDEKNVTDAWAKADPKWTSSAEVAVKREKNRWVAEMSIPWSDLGMSKPKPGDQLTGNFYRSRYAGGEREEFSWSPIVEGLYFAPNDFGELILGN